jgi:hypothetical protein
MLVHHNETMTFEEFTNRYNIQRDLGGLKTELRGIAYDIMIDCDIQ